MIGRKIFICISSQKMKVKISTIHLSFSCTFIEPIKQREKCLKKGTNKQEDIGNAL